MAGAYRSAVALEAGLDHILSSPTDEGRLELIVRRPAEDEREVLDGFPSGPTVAATVHTIR